MRIIHQIKFISVLFCLVFLNFSPAFAKKRHPKIKAGESITSILQKYNIDPNQVSLQMLLDDEVVDELNPSQLKIPASVSKILTTYAVLKNLPLGHKFKTQLFFDGENLYLKGGGDPSFVSENMWFLVNEFYRQGISTINKDIVVDDTLFDNVRFDESRESKRVDRAYDSPVGAMSFNWNAVNIYVKPGKVGKSAQVTIDPESDFYSLKNQTETVSGRPKKDLVIIVSNENHTITAKGDVSKNAEEKAIYKSVDEPDIWSATNLKSFLLQRGIQVKGKIRQGKVPMKAELVASSESKSTATILADMNKFSNNFVAEMLTKNLGTKNKSEKASLQDGVSVIRTELKNLGLTDKDFVVENPSGLTRNNRLSASTLNKVLSALKNDFTAYSTVLESLPIAGIDGTLKKRMKNTAAEGWVRAKTGYLDGVVSLAGFAGKKNGDVFTFSFLYNGPQDEAKVREAFDQILVSKLQ